MATMVLCVALALVVLAPGTAIGRLLRRLLIDLPARKLNQARPAHLAAGLVALSLAVAVIVYAKTEGMMVVAQGFPEGWAWFAMFDVATYVDAIALLALLAATVRLRAAYDVLRASTARAKRGALQFIAALKARQGRRATLAPDRNRRRTPTAPSDEDRAWPVLAPA